MGTAELWLPGMLVGALVIIGLIGTALYFSLRGYFRVRDEIFQTRELLYEVLEHQYRYVIYSPGADLMEQSLAYPECQNVWAETLRGLEELPTSEQILALDAIRQHLQVFAITQDGRTRWFDEGDFFKSLRNLVLDRRYPTPLTDKQVECRADLLVVAYRSLLEQMKSLSGMFR